MSEKSLVAIIMGSDSDWPLVKKASETLTRFGVTHDVRVMSAHRTPENIRAYMASAETERGVNVFIAAAGKAAHLPGVIASFTTKPVIGLPISSQALGGMDALLSIVQMPSGIPVATVALDGAENAALLAVQMLSLKMPELANALTEHRRKMAETVMEKDQALQESLK